MGPATGDGRDWGRGPGASCLATTPRRRPCAPCAVKLMAATRAPLAVVVHLNCCRVCAAALVAITSRDTPTWRGPTPPASASVLAEASALRVTRAGGGATEALRDLMLATPWSALADCTRPSICNPGGPARNEVGLPPTHYRHIRPAKRPQPPQPRQRASQHYFSLHLPKNARANTPLNTETR